MAGAVGVAAAAGVAVVRVGVVARPAAVVQVGVVPGAVVRAGPAAQVLGLGRALALVQAATVQARPAPAVARDRPATVQRREAPEAGMAAA